MPEYSAVHSMAFYNEPGAAIPPTVGPSRGVMERRRNSPSRRLVLDAARHGRQPASVVSGGWGFVIVLLILLVPLNALAGAAIDYVLALVAEGCRGAEKSWIHAFSHRCRQHELDNRRV